MVMGSASSVYYSSGGDPLPSLLVGGGYNVVQYRGTSGPWVLLPSALFVLLKKSL